MLTSEAITLFNEKLYSLRMIANKLGVTPMGVKKFLNRNGIDTKKRKWVVRCDECGKEFLKHRCQIRENEENFCSRECYFVHRHNPTAIIHRQSMRQARRIVERFFDLKIGHVVHHVDGNDYNNNPKNLWVFENNSDHTKFHHHNNNASPIWRGDLWTPP